MSREQVTVDFDTSELLKVVEEYEKRGGQVSRLMPTVASILVEAVDYQFDTEGEGKWKQSMRAMLQGGKTLQNTEVLAHVQPDHGEDWAEAFTNAPYGIFHLPPEKSGHPSKGIMPVRDFLDVNEDEVLEEIESLFAKFVTE